MKQPPGDHPAEMLADQLLAEALPAPVFVVQDQRFIYVNPAFADFMALERRELIGHDSLERVHPDDRNVVQERQWAAGQGMRTDSSAQLRVRRGDGAERSVIVTTTLIAHEGRSAILGTMVDITLQPDVLNMSVRMAALGRLAGGVAHDFNNLLLVIGGQVEKLQQELSPTNELRQAVDAIGTAADRAAILTDQLLSFGRRQMLTPQVTDLGAMVAEMEPQLRPRLGASVRLSLEGASGVPPIRADRPRLRQVLRHLVDNARDAMASGGEITIAVDTIEVDADLKARWTFLSVGRPFVRLRVIDTGAGMDPDVMPHVFEPFFTTKGRARGAGMGLASVYGIVKQSAGYVFVERTGADGTCVTILLPPRAAVDESPRPAPQVERKASIPQRPRILLVEDEMAVREMLADVLAQHGFDVSAAETGEEGESQAGDQPFDLLLTDIDLPGMNGANLAASLKARFPQLSIILMSGYPDDGAIEAAGLGEKAILLRKPFSTAQLVARIHQTLSSARF